MNIPGVYDVATVQEKESALISDHMIIVPVTLKANANGYSKNLVIALNTSTGKYEAYASGGSNGLDTPKGILIEEIPPAVTPYDVQANMLIHGAVKESLCISDGVTGTVSAAVKSALKLIAFV